MKLIDCVNKEYEDVKQNIVLEPPIYENKKFFEEILFSPTILGAETYSESETEEISQKYQNIFHQTPWTPEDIFLLCEKIKEEKRAYYFLSFGIILTRLINTHHLLTGHKDYLLKTEDSETKLPNLCYENNGANVTIYGPVGNNCCKKMRAGTVQIVGDCTGSLCAYMKGGIVSVKGDCKGNIGTDMKNGIIDITGNAKHEVGTNMSGGMIVLSGDAFYVGEMTRGVIHVNGTIHNLHRSSMQGGYIYNRRKRVDPK